MWHKNPDFYH